METVIDKIQALKKVHTLSKHEQLVKGVINAIDEKILVKGNMLPSVNHMVRELGFARKTIVKAYVDLKERGIVESKNRLGYFIANDATAQTVKVALILFAFHNFQEKFYNTFRKVLGENIQMDIFFHHNNIDVLESTLMSIRAKYGMYVVAPIPDKRVVGMLKDIPPHKLLIVDRYLDMGPDYSYVTQQFEAPMFKTLLSLKDTIAKYENKVLFFKPKSDYPLGILQAYQKFMEESDWAGKVKSHYESGSVKKGTVYFTISDTDLWEILKDCEQQGLVIGKDVGILSQNTSTVKEIICGGITTFSTDFNLMARKSAEYVINREKIQTLIPSILTRRTSL